MPRKLVFTLSVLMCFAVSLACGGGSVTTPAVSQTPSPSPSATITSTPSPIVTPTPTLPAIMAGSRHSVAVLSDGTVLTWGNNSDGQLGLGDTDDRNTPLQVSELDGKSVSQLISGGFHNFALCENGSIYTWGQNGFGQLGLGNELPRRDPALFEGLPDKVVVQLVAGHTHSMALCSDGSVYAWGDNYYGQLGLGDSGGGTHRNAPVTVSGLTDKGVIRLYAARFSSFALCSDGSIYAWGNNFAGQLGLGDSGAGTNREIPTYSVLLSDLGMVSVCGGNYHTVGLSSSGSVHIWGDGETTPLIVPEFAGLEVTQLSAGYDHMLALLKDGSVYGWGSNSNGQLGLGDASWIDAPTPIGGLGGITLVWVSTHGDHTLALGADGLIYAWGANSFGQLGLGDYGAGTDRNLPMLVRDLCDPTGFKVVAGGSHSLALRPDGTVLAWGSNSSGSLGLGDYDDRSTPTQVTELASRFVTQLTAGHLFSMALCSDGSVHTWGANGSGQLGLDDTTRRNAPAVVSAFNGMAVKQVVAGGSHGLALLMDGSVYTWGANHYGQLGHGDSGASAGRTSPTLVSALEGKGVVLLSAGHHSSFALCSDGSVYAWGSNEFGQLGLGDAEVGVNRNTPTLVTSLSDKGVADFGKGHKYSLALCSDGSVYSWGSGNGTPSLVSELSDRAATQVVCGYDFMLVLCDDGSVHAWGSNGMGVLGLGDTDARTAPTLVTALEGKGVIGISSWDGHCLAACANGEAYSWGDNWFGKLGLGTDRDSDPIRTLPARVLLP